MNQTITAEDCAQFILDGSLSQTLPLSIAIVVILGLEYYFGKNQPFGASSLVSLLFDLFLKVFSKLKRSVSSTHLSLRINHTGHSTLPTVVITHPSVNGTTPQ